MSDFEYSSYPPRRPITPFGLVFRHIPLFLLCILVFAGAGAALGLSRTTTYTAESRVTVTKLDVQTQALPGYAQAAQSLASAYARQAEATDVQRCAETASGERLMNSSALAGSPVPRSPVIRVIAKAGTSGGAMALANKGANCLVDDVTQRATTDPSKRYLDDYATASQRIDELSDQLSDLREENPDPSAAQRRRENRLQSRIAVQQLIKENLGARYGSAISNQSQVENVSVLTEAVSASDDRLRQLAISTFSGGVVGLLVALAIAAVIETRQVRRLSPAAAERG